MKYRSKIIIYFILISIFIPILINALLSMDVIPSKYTSSGEWLSFWGSFLGGIIGGAGTLIGVLLTLNHESENREEQAKKEALQRIPRLIPIKKVFYLQCEGRKIKPVNKKLENCKNYLESLDSELKIANASREAAIDIKIKWSGPNTGVRKRCKETGNITKEDLEEFWNKDSEENHVINECEFIAGVTETIVSLEDYFMWSIVNFIKLWLEDKVDFDGKIFADKDRAIGELEIECKNVYSETVNSRYKINLSLLKHSSGSGDIIGELSFSLIKDLSK